MGGWAGLGGRTGARRCGERGGCMKMCGVESVMVEGGLGGMARGRVGAGLVTRWGYEAAAQVGECGMDSEMVACIMHFFTQPQFKCATQDALKRMHAV